MSSPQCGYDVSRWVAEGEQQFVFSRVQGSGQDGVAGPAEDHTGDKQGELQHTASQPLVVELQTNIREDFTITLLGPSPG